MFGAFLSLAFLGFFEAATPAAVEAEVPVVTRPCAPTAYELAWEMTVNLPGVSRAWLYDAADRLVAGPAAAKTFTVTKPALWSPESPTTYRIVVETDDGRLLSWPVAFRRYGLNNGRFILNGRHLPLRSLTRGDAPYGDESERTMLEELRFLKAANCNAVTGNVHPGSSLWRRLCLESGVFIAEKGEPVDVRFCRDEAEFRALRDANRAWTVKGTNFFQRVVVRNGNVFTSADGVSLDWQVLRNGVPGAKGSFDLRGLKPRAEAVYDLPDAVQEARAGDASVSVRFAFMKGPALLARDQLDVADARSLEPLVASRAPIAYTDADETFTFSTAAADIVFSKLTGGPVSIVRKNRLTPNRELLAYGLSLDVWRPPFPEESASAAELLRQGLRRPVAEVREISPIDDRGGALTFTTVVDWRGWRAERLDQVAGGYVDDGPAGGGSQVAFEVVSRWTVCPDGTLACLSKVRPSGPVLTLPHLGWTFTVAEPDAEVAWFGRGPWENRPGLAGGAFLGRWALAAADCVDPLDPRSEGLRTEVRGFAAGGLAVRTLGAPFAFAARPSDAAEGVRLGFYASVGASTDRDYEFAFTLAPSSGDPLTARVYDGSTELPALTERPAGDTNDNTNKDSGSAPTEESADSK